MSNGLGAAFGGLLLAAVLAGLAVLLALSLVGVVVFHRRTGAVPDGLRYLILALIAGVVLIAGFAVGALYDEAATLAAVFIALVFIPLVVAGIYLYRVTELSRLDTIVTTGLAWSIPFLFGLVVTFGTPTVINNTFSLTPGESRQLGIYWGVAVLGALVVGFGTLWFSKRVSKPLYSATTP